jgi:hypothetical protein
LSSSSSSYYVTSSTSSSIKIPLSTGYNTTSAYSEEPYYPTNATTIVKATGAATVPVYTTYSTSAGAVSATPSAPLPGTANQASISFGLAAAGILGLVATLF